jgi:hypothetical protein
MNMNAMLIRSTVLLVVAMVLAFTASRQMPVAHAQSVGTHAAPAVVATASAPIELPTITVRPSASDLMEARAQGGSTEGGVLVNTSATDAIYETLTPNMPSLRMDVPYYSFGKALRRGVKE